MDFNWAEIWQFIPNVFMVVRDYFLVMLNSPTVIAAIIAFIFTPWSAIRTFLKQQRISSIQKIYYEESLLEQLNHLNNTVSITNENFAYFENAINLILIDLKRLPNTILSLNEFTQSTNYFLKEISKKIKSPAMYQSSKKEIIITLFKKYGYVIHQWLFKFDNDFRVFNLHIREVIVALRSLDRLKINVHKQMLEINNFYCLLTRHQTLIYLFDKIVSRIGILNFNSSKNLINNIIKDKEINESLKKFDEVFKILFGYYQLEDDFLISYLTDENKNQFKLKIENKNVSIERIKYTGMLDNSKIKIVNNDILLSGIKVDINGVQYKYVSIQVDLANLCAFHEKPMFYPEFLL